MISPLVYYAVWILVPILPAFAFFKYVAGRADVSGPFHGLKIRLGGAFAGYFLILVASYPFISRQVSRTGADKWLVNGNIKLDSQTDQPQLAVVLVQPPSPSIQVNGDFSVNLLLPTQATGPADTPYLIVHYEGYQPVSIPIDPYGNAASSGAYGAPDFQVKVDAKNHRINVTRPITLQKVPSSPYNPPPAPLKPAT